MTIELTSEEVNAVLQVLAQLPYNQSVGLINKISAQANEQEANKNAEKLLKKAK